MAKKKESKKLVPESFKESLLNSIERSLEYLPDPEKGERDRLGFIVHFANQNLASLRPGDVLNLQDNLKAWFGIAEILHFEQRIRTAASRGFEIAVVPSDWILDLTIDDFQRIQQDVCCLLDGRETTFELKPRVVSINSSRLPTIQFGSVREAMLLKLTFLLFNNRERIMRCILCSKYFYRVKLQKYCSRECTTKANYRGWYEQQKRKKKANSKSMKRNRRLGN